jgi:hypothetical protein
MFGATESVINSDAARIAATTSSSAMTGKSCGAIARTI